MIPIKATIEDIDKLLAFLRPTFGWVALTKVKATLDSKVTDNRKLDAAKYIGMISRDGQNVEITDEGRAFASTQDSNERAAIMANQLAKDPLYLATVEWMYHSNKLEPTKTDIGEQWHRHHTELLGGAAGAALGDGVIFFMRVAEAGGLGKFITAGNRRPETYFKGDRTAIVEFAKQYLLGQTPAEEPDAARSDVTAVPPTTIPPAAPGTIPQVTVQTSPAIHINIEIHIAADATAETVAEIFKNMRKYVLSNPNEASEDGE